MSKHIDPADIRRLYVDERRSIAETAAALGCRWGNVQRRLDRLGIERRPVGRQRGAERPQPPAPTPGRCRVCGRPIRRNARCSICIAVEGL